MAAPARATVCRGGTISTREVGRFLWRHWEADCHTCGYHWRFGIGSTRDQVKGVVFIACYFGHHQDGRLASGLEA